MEVGNALCAETHIFADTETRSSVRDEWTDDIHDARQLVACDFGRVAFRFAWRAASVRLRIVAAACLNADIAMQRHADVIEPGGNFFVAALIYW